MSMRTMRAVLHAGGGATSPSRQTISGSSAPGWAATGKASIRVASRVGASAHRPHRVPLRLFIGRPSADARHHRQLVVRPRQKTVHRPVAQPSRRE